MKTTRNVPRSQRAVYSSGSLKAGFFEYEVTGYETRGAARGAFAMTGRAEFAKGDGKAADAAREQAKKAAWAAARTWVSELGPLVRTDSDLTSSGDT